MENPDGEVWNQKHSFINNNNLISDETKKGRGISQNGDNEFSKPNELISARFLGSLTGVPVWKRGPFARQAKLHDRITHEETEFTEHLQANLEMVGLLGEFFPSRWLYEITDTFRGINASVLAIKTLKDRFLSYLGFVEIYLTFRGLTVLDSTLKDINDSLKKSFDTPFTKDEIRTWKMKIIKAIPELRDQWIKTRKQAHQITLVSTVITIMNRELVLTGYTKEQIFAIKQTALSIVKSFASHPETCHIKKPEVWARAICLKAVRSILGDSHRVMFPGLAESSKNNLENKIWQIENRFNIA